MVTRNFKNFLAGILGSSGTNYYGTLPIKGCDGTTYYMCNGYRQYPYSSTVTLALAATTAGFVLGSGTTPATENDYKIETPITSGISCTPTRANGADNNGNPYVEWTLVVTNTGSTDITVTEIAYNQTLQVVTAAGGTSAQNKVVCLDHTLLDSPVTIAAGSQSTIKYRLTSVVSADE